MQCETHVFPADVPPHPGDPKIQRPGLSSEVRILVFPLSSPLPASLTRSFTAGWSNSKRRYVRFARSNECASSVDMPSRRRTRVRLGFSRRTTRPANEAGTVRWPVPEATVPARRDDHGFLSGSLLHLYFSKGRVVLPFLYVSRCLVGFNGDGTGSLFVGMAAREARKHKNSASPSHVEARPSTSLWMALLF